MLTSGYRGVKYFTIAHMRYSSLVLRDCVWRRIRVVARPVDSRQWRSLRAFGDVKSPPPRPQPAPVIEFFEVHEQSIVDLQSAMTSGRVTSRGLVDSYLARIQAYDQAGPRLNSIVLLNPRAREEADAMDRERADKGPRGPLHGIPVLIKDNYDTADMPTSGGALALATLQPSADAFQVKKLRDAGAVILGKTTMHELASGITNISSLTSQTRNPYDLYRTPGGSSGGTGAAIGASFAAAGMGSDTCGSIRIPAANQNLVGLRGTHGLSSRSGVMPLSSTQDIAGPLARTVTDLAIMLDATVGPDPADPITKENAGHIPKTYRESLVEGGLKGARIGVLRSLWGSAPEDEEVAGIVRRALDSMKTQGAEVVDVAVPGLDDLLRESSVIDDEFKFDLMAYLAKHPNAPVKSLGDVIERGLHHAALDTQLQVAQCAGEARDRALPAGDDQTPRGSRRRAGDARGAAHRRARLPHAAAQAGGDRRSADRHQLPVERDDRTAGDHDSRPASPPTACRSASSCSAARGRRRSC